MRPDCAPWPPACAAVRGMGYHCSAMFAPMSGRVPRTNGRSSSRWPIVCRPTSIGRCFRAVDPLSDGSSKLIAIDEETNHQIMPGRRFGKANRATHETRDPGPQLERFALDVLRVLLANVMRLWLDVSFVSPPSTVVKFTREAPKAVLTPDETPLKQDECTSTSAASQGAAGDGGSDEHRWHGAGHTRQPSGWVQGGPTGSPQSDLPAGYIRGGSVGLCCDAGMS